ncbi:PAS domain S-box protein [Paenibacillus sp. sptzw28]|uniref:PAS domain-containing sensor histidine kinase n=1 Tax=Paenibacillus sp. sptzw28 TaxID=715179 RepID=UPI001C6E8AFF|nr:PAS domain-containing sensor histidine kinase [Paenibacillus sp. sptzw28]QYR23307.1 PAS domain S-box protein [Paenibacillus sp. sptzw28]
MKNNDDMISKLYIADEYEILERVTDGFFAMDNNGTINYANSAARHLIFQECMDVVGKCLSSDFPQALSPRFYTEYINAITQQCEIEYDEFSPNLNKWFAVRGYPSATGISVYFRDITELKKLSAKCEQHYKSLFEQNPEAICSFDPDGNFLDANQATQRMLGYSADELLTESFRSFVQEKDAEKTAIHFNKAASGIAQFYEVGILRKDGTPLDIHVVNIPIVVDGEVVSVYGIAKDVTERNKTEALLRKSEKILAESQAMLHVGSWEHDFQQMTSYWSAETFRIFGIEPGPHGSIATEEHLKRIHPEDRAKVMQAVADGHKGKQFGIEYRVIRPNGEERVVYSTRNSDTNAEGRMSGIIQDITDLKRTERELWESEQRYKSFAGNHPDGICSIDTKGRFTCVNPAYERLTGYSRSELLRMDYRDILIPEDVERMRAIYGEAAGDAFPDRIEVRIRTKEGRIVYVSCTIVPIIMTGGIVGMYSIVKDMTQQKETEELLRKSEKLSVVGELAAAVAHEIRNPLTALKGFIKLLQMKGTDSRQDYFEIINDELARIEMISSEMLVLSKPHVTRNVELSLKNIINHVNILLNSEANMKSIEIITDFEEGLSPIVGEETQLKQVFVNLLKNAIEAMPGGGSILVTMKRISAHIRVEIIDEGCGIPEDKLEKLGEPFYSTKEKGTGLGLLVTHRIIDAHNGRMEISSKIGKGTTISVYLPVYG